MRVIKSLFIPFVLSCSLTLNAEDGAAASASGEVGKQSAINTAGAIFIVGAIAGILVSTLSSSGKGLQSH